jgi:osmotically inducible lipoprotein OsmB
MKLSVAAATAILAAAAIAGCTTMEERVSGAATGGLAGAVVAGPIGAAAGAAGGAVAAPHVCARTTHC